MKQRTRVLGRYGAVLTLLMGMLVLAIIPAFAAQTTYVIGVDAASPAGHNFGYTDMFPRTGVSVHNSDVIDLKWDTGSADGIHTGTVLKQGETPAQAFVAYPAYVPDPDDGLTVFQINPVAVAEPLYPASGPCGTTAALACPYDGTADISSGLSKSAPGFDFFVQLKLATGFTGQVTFVCLLHTGMQSVVNVVADAAPATTLAAVQTLADAQHAASTANALAAETAVSNAAATTNPNGSKTWNVTAGSSTADGLVQIFEMLPLNLNVTVGDSVNWTAKGTGDVHTVTFPSGNVSLPIDPYPDPICEGTPSDTPAPTPAGAFPFGCANAAAVESPYVPQPQGVSALASPSTLGTSGIIYAAAGGTSYPSQYQFTFLGAGSYSYQCRVHDSMVGAVLAAAVVAPAQTPVATPAPVALATTSGKPLTAGPMTTHFAPLSARIWTLGLALAGLVGLIGLTVLFINRSRRERGVE